MKCRDPDLRGEPLANNDFRCGQMHVMGITGAEWFMGFRLGRQAKR